MKFGKRLKRQIEETLPGWRDMFLSYKDLKRQVRLISSDAPGRAFSSPPGRAAVLEFVRMLNAEVHKLNVFFIEQEEDFVIRHKVGEEKRLLDGGRGASFS